MACSGGCTPWLLLATGRSFGWGYGVRDGSTPGHLRQGHGLPTSPRHARRVTCTSEQRVLTEGQEPPWGHSPCGGRRLHRPTPACQHLVALAHPLERTHLQRSPPSPRRRTPGLAGANPGGRAKCAHGVMVGRRRASFPLSPALFLQGIWRRGACMRHHMRAVIVASGAMSEAMTFSTPRGFTQDARPQRGSGPPRWGRVDQPCPGAACQADVVGAYDGPRGQCRDPRRHGGRPRVDLVRTPAWLLGRAVFALTDPRGQARSLSNAITATQSLYSAHRRRAASDNTKRNIVDLRRRMVFGYSYANFLYGSVMV